MVYRRAMNPIVLAEKEFLSYECCCSLDRCDHTAVAAIYIGHTHTQTDRQTH